jgi:threonine dehydrogenase-like Zn-dependent dehydrogenase
VNPRLPARATVAWLREPGVLDMIDEPLREPGADEILCETLASAISPGTELAAFRGLPPLREGANYPRLMGYCNVARVLSCGPGTSEPGVGQRVLTFQSHRSHFVAPAREVLLTIPDDVPSDAAAVTYLFHLGYNAVLRSDVRAGSRVLIIGLGAIGLASVALASLAGAEIRTVSEHDAAHQRARRLGKVRGFSRAEAARQCADWADVVIATTNAWLDWSLALASATMRGVIAVIGFPGRGEPPPAGNPLDSRHFYARQLRIEAVGHSPQEADARGFSRFNERANLTFLLGLIADGTLRWQELISGSYPGASLEQAYTDLLARSNDPVTYALRWHPD